MTTASPRLYGRRKGRPLRTRKAKLVEELLPRLRISLTDAGTSKNPDPHALFSFRADQLWLEIGFGGGEHLAAQALRNPAIGMIGCEPFVNGVASLCDHIDRDEIRNIRIFPDDARRLLDALPDAVIDRCFILFPDPWPKARHAERRFVGSENLSRLARVLRPGAELRLATDDEQLKGWIQNILQTAKDFKALGNANTPPEDWVPTRYEQKAIKSGRQPLYMRWRRI